MVSSGLFRIRTWGKRGAGRKRVSASFLLLRILYSGLNSVLVCARNSSKVIVPMSPLERSRTARVPFSASFAPITSRADYEHVGDFLELRVADFFAELFVARVYLDADARFAELRGGLVGALDVVLRDWEDARLHGGEPEGEGS